MERTPRLYRITLQSLPPVQDATIFVPVPAVDEEQGALVAGVDGRAVNESAPTERGPPITGDFTGRQDMYTAARNTGRAASDRAVPKNLSAVDATDGTDPGMVPATAEGGQGGQDESQASSGCKRTATPTSDGQTAAVLGYDQYSDLYLYGRPVSSFWEALWISLPLALHDQGLLSMRQFIARCRKGSNFGFDLTKEITSVLEHHPGPISSFRIDSCTWTGGSHQLAQWLGNLSAKGIQDLIVVNRLLPTDTSFPLSMLQGSSLTSLRVAFMDLPDLAVDGFNYTMLDTLELTGCRYCRDALGAVISECTSLRFLVIGCSDQNLSVTSQTLISAQFWNCKASALTISYAPKLLRLATGIRPRERLHSVKISLNCVEALAEINCLMLPFHDLTVKTASVIQGLVALPQIRKLRLGIQLGSSHQLHALVSILKRLPSLAYLTILTVEDPATNVVPALGSTSPSGPISAIGTSTCVQMCLHSLTMEGFRGGQEEVAVIASILRNASKLAEVILEPDSSLDFVAAYQTAEMLEQCPRASIGCKINLTHLD